MIICIHIHTAYTLTVKFGRKIIVYLPSACLIHYIETFVRSDIVVALPTDDRIYNTSLHSDRTVYILERGLGKSEQSES